MIIIILQLVEEVATAARGDRNPLKYEGFSLDLSAHSRFAFTFNKYGILYEEILSKMIKI